MNNAPKLTDVAGLSLDTWENVIRAARKRTLDSITDPTFDQFRGERSKYHPALIGGVIILLAIVSVAAFYLSAIKEVAALHTIFAPVAAEYPQIAETVNAGIIAGLCLTEFGAILFGLSAHIFGERRWSVVVLRFFQLACVVIAVIANGTITVLHPVTKAWFFDWLLTLAPPVLVIGDGLVLEGLIHSWIVARYDRLQGFAEAVRKTEERRARPENEPAYWNTFARGVLAALMEVSPRNQEIIGYLVQLDPKVRNKLVLREWKKFQWDFKPVSETPETKPETSGASQGQNPGTSPEIVSNVPKPVSETPETKPETSGAQPPTQTGPEPAKPSMKKEQAIKILRADPTLKGLSIDKLASLYGGSRSTWDRAKGDVDKEGVA